MADNGVNPAHEGINGYGMALDLGRADPANDAALRDFAAGLMTELSERCLEAGARDIGHIKAHLEGEGVFLYASVVGDGSQITVTGRDGAPVSALRLTVNSVVFGMTKDRVKEVTESAVGSVTKKFGFNVIGQLAPGASKSEQGE